MIRLPLCLIFSSAVCLFGTEEIPCEQSSSLASSQAQEEMAPSGEEDCIAENQSKKNLKQVSAPTDSWTIDCKTSPRVYSVYGDHVFGRGVGFNEGYSTFGFFTAPRFIGNWLPFLDLRGHVFNNGRWAANGGLGVRYFIESKNAFFGANFFYDYRRYRKKNYNQVGAGLELAGEILALRANGYVPVGSDTQVINYTFKKFSGNNVILNENAYLAMWGLDAEIDAHLISYKGGEFNLAAGPYYYQGDFGKSTTGGKVRASILYRNTLYARGETTFDRVFHWRFQGEVGLNIPFGPRFNKPETQKSGSLTCSNDAALLRRLTQPVERQEIVVLSKQKRPLTAIDPSTGNPFVFYFVNNLNILPGAGTIESPFATLASAQSASNSGDTIYLFYGNGSALGYTTGLTMKDNQRFFGSAVDQVIAATVGNVTIPAQDPGKYADITNPGAANSVITLADNNEISGLQIVSTAASLNGILGTNLRRPPYIHDNRIFNFGTAAGTAEAGIRLTWTATTVVSTPLVIMNNLVTITNGATGNNNGIFIDFTAAGTNQLEVNIQNNNLVANNVSGIQIDRANAAGVLNLLGTISNNNISGNTNNGIHLSVTAGQSNLMLTMNANTITGNATAAGNAGILMASGVSGTAYINNNFIANNANGAITTTIGAFSMGIQALNNNLFNNGTGATFTTSVAGSILDLEFRNNQGLSTGFNFTRTAGLFQAHVSGNVGQLAITGGVTLLP